MNALSVAVLAVGMGLGLAVAGCKPKADFEVIAPPPVDSLSQTYWSLPDFSLTERSGQPVTLADLKGKVWIADFFYTSCPGPCPMLSTRLGDLQKELGSDDRVRFVSISADPEKDTEDVLKTYAERFHAGDHWLFLTGSKAAIHTLAHDGFKLPVAEDPKAAEPITHTTRLILVDQTGAIRGLYDGLNDENPARLPQDVRRLLESKP